MVSSSSTLALTVARKLISGLGEEIFAAFAAAAPSGIVAVSVVNLNSFCGGTMMFEDEGTVAPCAFKMEVKTMTRHERVAISDQIKSQAGKMLTYMSTERASLYPGSLCANRHLYMKLL